MSGIGHKVKCLVNYSYSVTQIMTPYSLTSTVNQSCSCQDKSNYNPVITSAALKQRNSQAPISRINYD
jgi:hypothetical protein